MQCINSDTSVWKIGGRILGTVSMFMKILRVRDEEFKDASGSFAGLYACHSSETGEGIFVKPNIGEFD
jgi:hypothetical protein